jgi:hypothetical protein
MNVPIHIEMPNIDVPNVALAVADPFGHGWCLLQFLGRGYDELST